MGSALIEWIEPETAAPVVLEPPLWQLDSIDQDDWSDKEVTSPKPALSKRRLCRGFSPPVAVRGLVDVLDETEKAYLARAPGNSLSDAALRQEHDNVTREYNAEQVRIASTLVAPSPGVSLPPPGVTYTPLLPTIRAEAQRGHRRGDPPMSIMGVLPRPLGRSAPRGAEWYETCSIAEPEFLALVEHAKKLPPSS
jgi:hypothetical protein